MSIQSYEAIIPCEDPLPDKNGQAPLAGLPQISISCQKGVKTSWYSSFLSYFNVQIKAIIPCEGRLPEQKLENNLHPF